MNINKGKRFSGVLTSFGLSMLVAVSTPACADTWYDDDTPCRLEFWTDNDGVHIQRCCDESTTLEIPASIAGRRVVSIEECAFSYCERLLSLTIPPSVTSIGRYAFQGCRSLLSITLPDGLLCVEEGTFADCSSLLRAEIPDTVVYIDNAAFCYCESLLSVSVPPSVIAIGECAFAGCFNLRILELFEGLEFIEQCAFDGCNNLAPFSLPQSVSYIDESAFWGCYWYNGNEWPVPPEGLRLRYDWNDRDGVRITGWDGNAYGSLEIPEYIFNRRVTSIESYAFSGCDKLLSITIPTSVKSIGESAFDGCRNLSRVSLPEGICRIERATFRGCESLTTITIPSSVSHIGEEAFADCWSLIHVSIPAGLSSIGNRSFVNCESLLAIDIPSSVVNIGESSFESCRNLRIVTLSEGLLGIGNYAFQGCENLNSIAIPKSVAYIGENAFSSCYNLFSVSVDKDNPYLTFTDGILFDKTCTSILSISPGITHLVIPQSVTSVSISTLKSCRNVSSITVDPANPCYSSRDGLLYDKSFTRLIACPVTATCATIPEGVIAIGTQAFSSCAALTSVSLPSSLRTIEYGAFSGCSTLATLAIPDSVTTIGGSAFFGCYSLSSIELPTNITLISSSAFCNCTGLSSFIVPPKVTRIENYAFSGCSGLMAISIPDSVTHIGSSAFSRCSGLKSVTLPFGLTVINNSTFSGCTGLTALPIPTNVTQIGSSAFSGCTGLTTMVVPKSVTRIDYNAFNNCTGLSCVRYLGNAPSCNTSSSYYSIYSGADANLTTYTLPGSTGWSSPASTNLPSSWQGRNILHSSSIERQDVDVSDHYASNAVYLTVTNIVIHYIRTSEQPEFVTPSTPDTGYVNIITEVESGNAVVVPESWANNYPGFESKFGSNFTQALLKPTGKKDGAGNDMLVWQDYVAGTDPTDEKDVFTASITIVDGKVTVSYTPELDDARKAMRKYTTWGKKSLMDASWTEVQEGHEAEYNFFKLSVEMR